MRKEIIGNATLYLGDCREIIPTLPRVASIISDPPYGISHDPRPRHVARGDIYARGAFRTQFDRIHDDNIPFDPAQIIAIGVPTVLWGANNFASKLPDSEGWLCWYKAGGIKGFHTGECEMAWTNFLGSIRFFSHMWHGFKRQSEVGERVLHPTQKPVELMRWCLEVAKWPPSVLDPFMGSGSMGVACSDHQKDFIGIEIDERHFNTACERIENAQRQGRMFAD